MNEFFASQSVQGWVMFILCAFIAFLVFNDWDKKHPSRKKYGIGQYYPDVDGVYAGILLEYGRRYMVFVGPLCGRGPYSVFTWKVATQWASKWHQNQRRDVESRLPTIDELKFAFITVPGVFNPNLYWSCDTMMESAFAFDCLSGKTEILKQSEVAIGRIFRLIEVS